MLLILAYIFEKYLSTIDKYFYSSYFTKPILWFLIFFLVWSFPRGKIQGKYRLKNYINVLAFLCGGFYIIFMLAGGFLDGFGRSPYSFTIFSITTNLCYISTMILAKEFSRAYIVNHCEKRSKNLTLIFTSLFFTFLNLSIIKILSLNNVFGLIKYTGNTLFPLLSENILTTYLSFIGGPVPAIIYQSFLKGFQWLFPVLPNLSWISKTFLGTLLPFVSLIIVQHFYRTEIKESRNVSRKNENPFSWILTCCLSIIIVWFSVGLFPVYPKVVLTGSMKPMIEPGDVVILKEVNSKEIKLGDIIQYQYEEMDIIHRVIEVIQKNNTFYKTKGDNNSCADSEYVSRQQIEGKLIKVIPKIGWPSLFLRSIGGTSTENVEV